MSNAFGAWIRIVMREEFRTSSEELTIVNRSIISLLMAMALFVACAYARSAAGQDQSTTQDNSAQQSDTAQPSNPPQENTTPQGNTGPQGRRGHRGGGHWGAPSADQRLERLSKRLNLSADQQTKIKPILEDQQKQMESLRQDSSVSPQDRHAKMAELQQSSSGQIRAVLNEDQQKKFDKMQEKRRERMSRRMGAGGSEQQNH
jgi:hypothetical protein